MRIDFGFLTSEFWVMKKTNDLRKEMKLVVSQWQNRGKSQRAFCRDYGIVVV